MSASKIKLAAMKTPELIELAWEQATLTAALAERLEMAAREKEDLRKDLNQTENDDDCNE